MISLLFPSSYFSPSHVDEDLQKEYQTAKKTGLFHIMLFDYENWFLRGRLLLRNKPELPMMAIYRGWMMKPEQYTRFFHRLSENQIRLINHPEQYHRFHLFPEIYQQIREDTAEILLYPLYAELNVHEILKKFGRFMIKDYVKSVKDPRFPNLFDKNSTQSELDSYMHNFYQLRGDLLTGGICIKQYLDLKRYANCTNEYRVFYANHEILSVCQNSGQTGSTPAPPLELMQKYQFLDSMYYTLDFAECQDNSWKVLEAGDGGVSGLPQMEDTGQYYQNLYRLCAELTKK